MDCPICNFNELNEGAASCPQCHSDLEVFSHLTDARKQHHFQKKSVAVLSGLLAVVAVSWGATQIMSSGDESRENLQPVIAENADTQDPVELSPSPDGLKNENEALTAENKSLKAEINALNEKLTSTKKTAIESPNKMPAAEDKGTVIHTIKRGETLWIIARKYFGDGRKYKQIAKDNGLSKSKKLSIGMKIKINK